MTKEELEKEARVYANAVERKASRELVYLAYKDGAEPREKQIQIDAEQIRALQKQNGELTDEVKELKEKLEQTEKDLADYQFNYPTIKELQKENAELKRHIKADCIDCADYYKNKRLEKENAELQHKADTLQGFLDRDVEFDNLQKENAELREQCSILADCNTCVSACKTENIEMEKQLTKAKELLKQLVNIEYAVNIPKDKIISLRVKAEKFLKE